MSIDLATLATVEDSPTNTYHCLPVQKAPQKESGNRKHNNREQHPLYKACTGSFYMKKRETTFSIESAGISVSQSMKIWNLRTSSHGTLYMATGRKRHVAIEDKKKIYQHLHPQTSITMGSAPSNGTKNKRSFFRALQLQQQARNFARDLKLQ